MPRAGRSRVLSQPGTDRVSASQSRGPLLLAPGTVPLSPEVEKFHRIPRGLSYLVQPLAWLPKWSCCDDKVPLTGDSVSLSLCLESSAGSFYPGWHGERTASDWSSALLSDCDAALTARLILIPKLEKKTERKKKKKKKKIEERGHQPSSEGCRSSFIIWIERFP